MSDSESTGKKEAIIAELERSSIEYELVSEDMIREIYEIEREYSTLDRRHGMPDELRNIIEKNADLEELE